MKSAVALDVSVGASLLAKAVSQGRRLCEQNYAQVDKVIT